MILSSFLVEMTAMIVGLFALVAFGAFLAGRRDHARNDWRTRSNSGRDTMPGSKEAKARLEKFRSN